MNCRHDHNSKLLGIYSRAKGKRFESFNLFDPTKLEKIWKEMSCFFFFSFIILREVFEHARLSERDSTMRRLDNQ